MVGCVEVVVVVPTVVVWVGPAEDKVVVLSVLIVVAVVLSVEVVVETVVEAVVSLVFAVDVVCVCVGVVGPAEDRVDWVLD